MSPVAAPARSRTAPARRTAPRPALKVVTPVPSRAPRTPFVLLSMLIVGAGLAGLLVLNTAVAQDAFTLHDLGRRQAALVEQEQRLRREVAALEAPAALAARATKLGMVPAGDPVFVRPDGKVLGSAAPVTPAPPPPAPTQAATKPTAPAAPVASAKPSAKPAASAKPAPKPSAKPSAKASTKPAPKPTATATP